jgi:hypothetical protein
MSTRRCILKAAPFFATTAMFPTTGQSSDDQCSAQFAAQLLADALKRDHGGSWRVSFDRLNTFVLISKEN